MAPQASYTEDNTIYAYLGGGYLPSRLTHSPESNLRGGHLGAVPARLCRAAVGMARRRPCLAAAWNIAASGVLRSGVGKAAWSGVESDQDKVRSKGGITSAPKA